MNKERIVQPMLHEKKEFQHFIYITLFLAIGGGLLTSSLLLILKADKIPVILFILGCCLVLMGVVYHFMHLFAKLKKNVILKGLVIFKNGPKEMIEIPRYELSRDLVKYINAAVSENAAIGKVWIKEPVNPFQASVRVDEITRKEKSPEGFSAIIRVQDRNELSSFDCPLFLELLEYCIIQELSTHLSSYFENSNLNDIIRIKRVDIPDVLLNNRFIRLFSEDMNNRAMFSDLSESDKLDDEGEIVYSIHPSGAVYEYFELLLPRKSKVKRIDKNKISIETRMFSLTISINYNGFGTNLPFKFGQYYMGFSSMLEQRAYEIEVSINVKFTIRSLFVQRKWDYFKWADDFIDRLDDYLSAETFYQKINWDTTLTVIRGLGVLNRRKYEKTQSHERKT